MTTPPRRRRLKYICSVSYCPHYPPRYTPRPSGKCHSVWRCMNIHVTEEA